MYYEARLVCAALTHVLCDSGNCSVSNPLARDREENGEYGPARRSRRGMFRSRTHTLNH